MATARGQDHGSWIRQDGLDRTRPSRGSAAVGLGEEWAGSAPAAGRKGAREVRNCEHDQVQRAAFLIAADSSGIKGGCDRTATNTGQSSLSFSRGRPAWPPRRVRRAAAWGPLHHQEPLEAQADGQVQNDGGNPQAPYAVTVRDQDVITQVRGQGGDPQGGGQPVALGPGLPVVQPDPDRSGPQRAEDGREHQAAADRGEGQRVSVILAQEPVGCSRPMISRIAMRRNAEALTGRTDSCR